MSIMSEAETEDKENSNGPTTTATVKEEWTTWEELLLTCAVKRHGVKDWDSVAMELQTRCFPANTTITAATATTNGTTTTLGLTPQICRDKFLDLQRRFATTGTTNSDDVTAGRDDGGDDLTLPWLEELRKLRVSELKQEVHRYDLSIQSLQMKVKRLEDERERSLKENDQNDDVNTDLENDKTTTNSVKNEEERSENNKKGEPDDIAGKSISGEDENRSFNESNSTDNRLTGLKLEPGPIEIKPETVEHIKPVPVGGEDSCNDSSDRRRASQEGKVDSAELRDSVDDSKEGTATKESSDVQSSASLSRKKRRKRVGGESGEGNNGGGRKESGCGDGGLDATTTTTTTTTTAAVLREIMVVKSEPLIRFLEIIRSHKHGPMFEHRLDIQKGDKYKSMVRQHVDLQAVQARIEDGFYSSCSNKFYLDLLLIFNNAIVFFPNSSHESRAAHELRDLVMKEIKRKRARSPDPQSEPMLAKLQPKPDPDRSDSLLAKHKSTAPLVVCRKRSSITAKASSSSGSKVEKLSDNKSILNSKPVIKSSSSTQNEDDSSIKLKLKEKPVTGVRSMRRSSKGRPVNNAAPATTNSNQNTSSSSHQQPPQPVSAQKGDDQKTDKKKVELNNAAAKKRGAADFLKRIKKNSPAKGSLGEAVIGSTDDSKGGKSDHQPKRKVEERKDVGPLRRSGNGNGKQAKEDNSPSKRSVGRPPKKGKDAAAGKRGREGGGGGEGEGSSKRPNKRSRR